jgi:hypothetical protein
MASDSVVRAVISGRESRFDLRSVVPALPAIWAGFLTLLVSGPWLEGGYIFGTDWPGPRRFDFPSDLSSSAPLEAALAAASRVVSGEWTGKLFVLALLFGAALLAFRAAPTDGFAPRAVASTVYVFNPFVFGRLHYGQLFLLAGYALLPWVTIRLRELLARPSLKAGLPLALSLVVVGIAATHLFLIAGVVVAALLVAHVIASGKRLEYARRVGPSLLLAVVATLVVSSYWVLPLVLGRGPIASEVAGITTGQLSVFAAVADPQLGLIPNLLGLYGFWAENTGRFTSMKSFVTFWPLILAVLLGVAAIGAAGGIKQRRDRLGAWVSGLLIAGAFALVLEMGVSSPVTRDLVTWLDATFPVYRGMRDAGKWAALLALVYSQLIALGTAAILGWIRSRPLASERTEWISAVATGLLLALTLFYGNGLLFGMHGEIRPSQYPAGWYAADRTLLADSHPDRTLFLPWHEYMSLSFVRNQNNVVCCPAPTFFSTPMVVDINPELPGGAGSTDPDQLAISELVRLGDQGRWAEVLAARDIKYVLLAREVDWKSYDFLNRQPDMAMVGDYGSIVLYRNNLIARGSAPGSG